MTDGGIVRGMRRAEWHARIECGGGVGAGFLVTDDTVLTCAHVVQDSDREPVTITFPQRPGAAAVSARVVAHGGWDDGHGTDLGDLAVLELDRTVDIAPALLASADIAHGDRKLVAYGFPAGHDKGTQAVVHTVGPLLVGGEWIELEAWSGHGQPLAVGFSGAAVTLVDTGEVVGMITAAAGAREVRTGRMMPTHVMARYWPGLDALLPPQPPAHPDGARLRALVDKAVRARLKCHPGRLYAEVVGAYDPDPPPEGFDSLRAAAWFVLYEVADPATATRFADHLESLLDAPSRSGRRPDWAPVLVELRHTGADDGLIRVEVSAYGRGRCHRVPPETVPRSRLRACVQEAIEAALARLPDGTDELITFALPRDWLDWPVDRWQRGPDDPVPLGCAYPLVVTDHVRRRPGTRRLLTRAWQELDAATGVQVHPVTCAGLEDPKRLRLRLWQSEACLAGFATVSRASRTRRHFEMSLTAPTPAIVWSRRGCESAGPSAGSDTGPETGKNTERGTGVGACAEACPGAAFLSALHTEFSHVPPAELPRRILALRREADAEDDHWARDIQLLWDDPRCFTDRSSTAVHVQSPVA